MYLIDKFIDLPAVTIKTISEEIGNQQTGKGILEFLPKDTEAVYIICLELNDRGHILLLKDRMAAENSYIVIDKTFLLSEISGTVFAPDTTPAICPKFVQKRIEKCFIYRLSK